jgi:DNA-binding transcriptional regulator YhcF (GntR family)
VNALGELTAERPIFIQIAETLEDAILSGTLSEEVQAPSTTEISVRYAINPATALKGVNLLVERGILYKKRGLGMFVAPGAARIIAQSRKEGFMEEFVLKLISEAKKLGISEGDVLEMVKKGYAHERD